MLKTEMRNKHTMHIDQMSTTEMMQVMQNENINAAKAVGEELEAIGKTVDAVSARMKEGGRLFYVGCGTSGRLGVLDASECPPTYGVPYDLVQGIIAGGYDALVKAGEGAEDSFDNGYCDLKAQNITEKDSVVGISVAGGAAYVLGAFACAKEAGALMVGLTCNRGSRVDMEADRSSTMIMARRTRPSLPLPRTSISSVGITASMPPAGSCPPRINLEVEPIR